MASGRRFAPADPLAFRADLKAYAAALARDGGVAESLVRDTLAAIYAGAPLPGDPARAKRQAFRMLRDLHRDDPARPPAGAASAGGDRGNAGRSRLPHASDAVDRIVIGDGFGRLAPEHREILFLIDVMGFRYAEAAELLDLPASAVMARVSRGRQALAATLDEGKVLSFDRVRKKFGR